MPRSKNGKSSGNSTASKVGRPVAVVETHPELITNYMELKPMVYDDLNLPDENEITRMIRDFSGKLARKETSSYGAFFRQLLDMFNVMAYDKLKGDTRDLSSVAKCQEIVTVWEDCIANMTLSEDYSNLILVHFPEGQFPDKFHHYLDTVRNVAPTGSETLDSWILDKFKDFARHSQQDKQKIYLGQAEDTCQRLPLPEIIYVSCRRCIICARRIKTKLASLSGFTALLLTYR